MFKLISKIDNIRDYVIYKGKPYYINTSHEFQCGEKKQMLYKMPLNSMVVFNNRFYFSELGGDNYKIFDENLELIEEGKEKVFYKLSEFYIAYEQDENNTILIDKKDNLIKLEYIDSSPISVFSNEYIYIYIYIYIKNKIYDDVMSIRAFSIQKKEHLWEFSLASFGKYKNSWDEERYFRVYKLIGIHNNIFWAFIELGGFIGLDIETGELKYRIPEYHQAVEKTITKIKGFYRSDYLLDSGKGKILGMAMDVFIEIDLNQELPFATQYGLQEEFEKYNIEGKDTSTQYIVQDDLLYFYLAEQLKFGILDINTKEIIYISEPIAVVERDDSFTRLRDLKVSENKVYILDSNNTLHIFEREEQLKITT